MSSCPSEALTALVDGALDHDERERVHAHLAGCAACRTEVEAERALKARLAALSAGTPAPGPDLLARLRGLAVPGVEPTGHRAAGRPGTPVPLGTRPGAGRPGGTRPPSRRAPGRSRRVARTGALGGGLLLLGAGVGLAMVLGGPRSSAPTTPVDPGSDTFVVDFVSTTGSVPLADPAGGAALLPAP